jgi:hypothetical protein
MLCPTGHQPLRAKTGLWSRVAAGRRRYRLERRRFHSTNSWNSFFRSIVESWRIRRVVDDCVLRRGESAARRLPASMAFAGMLDFALHEAPAPMAATAQTKKSWYVQLGGSPLSAVSVHHAPSAVVESASRALTVRTLRHRAATTAPKATTRCSTPVGHGRT